MLSLRHKSFDVSDRLCDAINQHPDWQIVQIVSKDGYLDLFYRAEDDAVSAEDAVNIKKGLTKSYRSNAKLPNVRSRKVDILEVRNEQDSSD